MKELLVTSCSNTIANNTEILVTLKSLAKVNFRGDKVLITNWLPFEIGDLIVRNGFRIVIMDSKHQLDVVNTDVFYYFLSVIKEGNYDNVYVCDFRDVLFLQNFQQPQPLHKVYLTKEGWKYKDNQWNIKDMDLLMGHLPKAEYKDWDVINGGGLIYGGAENIYRFYTIQSLFVNRGYNFSNQALINYLYYVCKMDDWDFTAPYFALHGEAIKGRENQFNYKNYTIFHQWDRTSFKDEILSSVS